MLYAKDKNGEKILALPGSSAVCSCCGTPVRPKCGVINVWHWAHVTRTVDFCEMKPETDWHLWWKSMFPKEMVEVPINRGKVVKIADVYLPKTKTVIEFQHSSISPEEIQFRESHYGNMLWVFDCTEQYEAGNIDLRFNSERNIETFRWKHAKKTLAYAHKPVYLQLNASSLFRLKKIYPQAPVGGWGHLGSVKKFITHFHEGEKVK
jgi:competence CoiA-like predicted nuclease